MDGAVLREKALKLTAVERVHLIDVLWESLDTPDQAKIDLACLAESERRLDAYHAGQLGALDGELVLETIENSLKS